MAAAQCTNPSESAPVVSGFRIKDVPWGLLTIPNPGNWKPKTAESGPQSVAPHMPAHLLVEFAALYNASDYARHRRRWAIVSSHGSLVILNDVDQAERPEDPRAFPPGTRLVTTRNAEALAAAENADRFQLAIIPREWTIAIRPLCRPEAPATEGSGEDVAA